MTRDSLEDDLLDILAGEDEDEGELEDLSEIVGSEWGPDA